MKSLKWLAVLGATLITLTSMTAFAKSKSHVHGKDKGRVEIKFRYSEHDRALRGWYEGRGGNLPPGLAKRYALPPGLENQLVTKGTLPPGLRKKMYRCPHEVVRLLPPPPPDYGHYFIGGNIVLVHRRTYMVLDIFRF